MSPVRSSGSRAGARSSDVSAGSRPSSAKSTTKCRPPPSPTVSRVTSSVMRRTRSSSATIIGPRRTAPFCLRAALITARRSICRESRAILRGSWSVVRAAESDRASCCRENGQSRRRRRSPPRAACSGRGRRLPASPARRAFSRVRHGLGAWGGGGRHPQTRNEMDLATRAADRAESRGADNTHLTDA